MWKERQRSRTEEDIGQIKKRELCSRIPTVLHTGLRDCSVRAEGEREEGREEIKKGEGRRFSAVRAEWMSSSRGTGEQHQHHKP